MDRHLGCFNILAIMNKAAKNIRVHITFQISVFVFFGKYPKLELLDHMVVLFLIFWGASILFSIVDVPIYTPTNSIQGFLFFHIFVSTCYFLSFDRCVVIFHCGFDLHFLNYLWCHIFSCAFWPSVWLLWKNVNSGLLTFFCMFFFFWYWVAWTLHIFWILTYCQLYHLQIFSPILRVVFLSCL